MPIANPKKHKHSPTVKQMAKSKSNEFNVVVAPAIVGILTAVGVTVPVPAIIAGYAVVNFFLRRYTTTPLNEK